MSVENFAKFEGYVYQLSSVVGFNTREKLNLSYLCQKEDSFSYIDEDLIQQGRMWLWEAISIYPSEVEKRKKQNEEIKKYNEQALLSGLPLQKEKPIASMSTYVYMYLRSMYLNLNTTGNAQRYISKEMVDTFKDSYTDEEESVQITPVSCSHDHENMIYFKQFYSELTEEDKEVLVAYYLEGRDKKELKKKFPLYNIDEKIIFLKKELQKRGEIQ